MSTAQNDPYQSQSRKSTIVIFVGAIALALMAGFAMGQGGLLRFAPGKSSDVAVVGDRPNTDLQAGSQPSVDPTQRVDPPAGADLQLGFDPSRPDLSHTSEPTGSGTQLADKMPYEVREWLKHLERCESERNRMTKAQLSKFLVQMMGMSGGGDLSDLLDEDGDGDGKTGVDQAQKDQFGTDTAASRKGWKDLVAFFNSKQPPAECVPIKNAYEQTLGETSAMMLDILNQLEKSQSDPQGALSSLMGMMGTSEGKIDVAAKKTDSLVGQICDKYETFKWFGVSGDIGGGLGGLGIGGLGGLGGGDLKDLLGGG